MGMNGEGWIDLGMAWNAIYWDAVHMWRDEYAPGTNEQDVLANDIRRITFAANCHPGGHFEVMVKVVARKRWQSEVFFTKIQRVSSLYYIV